MKRQQASNHQISFHLMSDYLPRDIVGAWHASPNLNKNVNSFERLYMLLDT